jgi:prepilin-type N-terminal cleavage/methylation domain-containing protein
LSDIPSRGAEAAGFALVEVLVAIAIAGLIGSTLVGSIAFFEQRRRDRERQDNIHQAVFAVDHLLRAVMDSAEPDLESRPQGTNVEGTAKRLAILSKGPPIMLLDRPLRLEFEVESHAGLAIVQSWQEPADGLPHRELVAAGFEAIAFAYLGKSPATGVSAWRPEWSRDMGSAQAVRVSLRPVGATMSFDIVVPIRAEVASACLRKPNQPACPFNQP